MTKCGDRDGKTTDKRWLNLYDGERREGNALSRLYSFVFQQKTNGGKDI